MPKGIVIKSTGSWYSVKGEDGTRVDCNIRGKFRLKGIKSTNPVAVGDIVDFFIPEGQDTGVINDLLDRKNYIIRKSINLSKRVHVLAANIDYALLVVTVSHPETTTMFIDRFLLSAEAYLIPVVIVFNKMDLYNDEEKQRINLYREIYELAGYKCLQISATKKTNIDELKQVMKDKTCVFAGHSGVGKTTIINMLEPGLDLRIAPLSESYNTGKHTTTFAEMHELSFGGYIVDTPGIKAFGIIDIEKKELFHFFIDIFKFSHSCQYYNCTHTHEPNCEVKQAVVEGKIHESRYSNYLDIFFDEDDKYRKPY